MTDRGGVNSTLELNLHEIKGRKVENDNEFGVGVRGSRSSVSQTHESRGMVVWRYGTKPSTLRQESEYSDPAVGNRRQDPTYHRGTLRTGGSWTLGQWNKPVLKKTTTLVQFYSSMTPFHPGFRVLITVIFLSLYLCVPVLLCLSVHFYVRPSSSR